MRLLPEGIEYCDSTSMIPPVKYHQLWPELDTASKIPSARDTTIMIPFKNRWVVVSRGIMWYYAIGSNLWYHELDTTSKIPPARDTTIMIPHDTTMWYFTGGIIENYIGELHLSTWLVAYFDIVVLYRAVCHAQFFTIIAMVFNVRLVGV